MSAFRSTDVPKELIDLMGSVEAGPTVLINRGQPQAVLMSAEEFRRLKAAAGEAARCGTPGEAVGPARR